MFISIAAFPIDYINIKGRVRDKALDTDIIGAKVTLYNLSDSTVAAETEATAKWFASYSGNWKEYQSSEFSFKNLPRNRKYLMVVTDEDYDTLRSVIDPTTINARKDLIDLRNIYMKRKATTLGELTVTATKVKFYNKGDTLVYNADAFVLAEGSMLDALIRQLPGVELKPDGQIYVNGRFVESLLLNGKDFFKGDNRIMLDNLGAYTVKNIAVYDRQDDMDKIMGKDYGEKKLTMDVRLKKEYAQGWLVNAEAGYGSSDRYLGRLFAMWYTDHARITLYGNTNNLSDQRKPGEDTGFNPSNMRSGDMTNHDGGIEYNATIPKKDVEFWGDVRMKYTDTKTTASIYTTNFLTGGDTYGYSFNTYRIKSFSVSSEHAAKFQKEKWNMLVSPSVKYTKTDEMSHLLSGVFNREWSDVDRDFLNAVYSNAGADVIASILNRNKDESKRRGHTLDTKLWSNGKFLLPNATDAITYLVSGSYNRQHYDHFQRFALNFGQDPTPTDYSDRYFRNHPDYTSNFTGAVGYIVAIMGGMHLNTYYTFERTERHAISDLYRLETLYDGTYGDLPLGQLPSLSEYQAALDPSNSYDSRLVTENHQYNLDFTWNYTPANLNIVLSIPLNFRHQRLHYLRGDINANLPRDRFFLGNMSAQVRWNGSRNRNLYFSYSRQVSSPDLVDMVDFSNDLDPLNIRTGNPRLKDSESNRFSLNFYKSNPSKHPIMQNYFMSANIYRNSLAYGYTYNRETGVRSGSMYNINGNFNLQGGQGLDVSFGKNNNFSLSNELFFTYRRSVDLVGETGVLNRNIVNNYGVNEGLSLGYRHGNSQVIAFGSGAFSRYESGMENFNPFNAWDINYGIRGSISLPANFGISTVFNVYSRCGYSDAALNTDNFVWNARLSWTAKKSGLTFMLDGFDILHSLTNVYYSVNAQARTETYTNVLPRYFMFHIQWKFHKRPKKHTN